MLALCFPIVGLQAAPKLEKFQVAGNLATLEDGLVAKGWHVAYVN